MFHEANDILFAGASQVDDASARMRLKVELPD
jgi:hypothetical protein